MTLNRCLCSTVDFAWGRTFVCFQTWWSWRVVVLSSLVALADSWNDRPQSLSATSRRPCVGCDCEAIASSQGLFFSCHRSSSATPVKSKDGESTIHHAAWKASNHCDIAWRWQKVVESGFLVEQGKAAAQHRSSVCFFRKNWEATRKMRSAGGRPGGESDAPRCGVPAPRGHASSRLSLTCRQTPTPRLKMSRPLLSPNCRAQPNYTWWLSNV